MNLSFFYKVIVAIMVVSCVVLIFFSYYRRPPDMHTVYRDEYGRHTNRCRRVLIVHSYDRDYAWTAGVNRGLFRVLNRPDLDVEMFYMETKKNPNSAWMTEMGKKARHLVEEWKPDVVVAVDDNAQLFFGMQMARETQIPLVFCGVNCSPQQYGYPASNITGVLEKPHYNETVDMLRSIIPGMHRIGVLTDSSITSEGVLDYLAKNSDSEGVELVSIKAVRRFGEWKKEVLAIQTNADVLAVYTYHTLVTDEGVRVPPVEVIRWTRESSRIPVAGFLVYSVDDGLLGGVVESSIGQGMAAGKQVLQVLAGVPAGAIDVVESIPGIRMLNMSEVQRYGLAPDGEFLESIEILVGDVP